MARIWKRSYISCPLMEEFHIRNILGSCEKRQWIFGGRVTTVTDTKAVTFTSLTGGIVENVTDSLIFAQKLNHAPSNKTFITSKTASGFTLNGDGASDYSIIVIATLPLHPKATPKWAKDYCPYCKNMGFKGIHGSSLKDLVCFSGSASTGAGGTVAVTFKDLTETSGSADQKGTQKKNLVTMMYDNEYQVALIQRDDAVTAPPYPSAITVDGFTLNGDASKGFDILILGQIRF